MSVPDPRQLHDDITTQVRNHVASPDAVHEQIVKSIRDMVAQMIDDRVPKMANVTGQDGGKLLVQMDDEDEPRQVGFAKKNGQRYNNGDRVVVMPTGGGDHVVLGTVNAAQGSQEQAVGNPDLIDSSVDENKIKPGAVKRNHIAGKAVGSNELDSGAVNTSHLSSNAVTNDKIAGNAVDTGQLKDNSVTSGKIASGAVGSDQLNNSLNSKIDNAASQSDLNDAVKDLPDQNDLDKKEDADDHKKDIDDVNSKIKDLDARLTRLEKK